MRTVLALLLAAAARPAHAGSVPPSAVTLSAAEVTRYGVVLRWTAPGDDGTTGQASSYDLRVSAVGAIDNATKFLAATAIAVPAPKTAGSQETFVVTGQSSGTVLYFALRTTDDNANVSNLSNSLEVTTLGISAPRRVEGTRLTRDTAAGNVVLTWDAVTKYADGSSNAYDSDFDRYAVQRADSPDGAWTPLAALSTNTLTYTDAGALAAGRFYRVLAGDRFGAFSDPGALFEAAPAQRVFFEAPQARARLAFPKSLQSLLYAPGNGRSGDLSIEWTRRSAEETGSVLRSYKIEAALENGGAAVSLAIPFPGATLTFPDAGTSSAAVFRYDGVEFHKIGGIGSEHAVEVTELGVYRLQSSLRASGLAVMSVVPRRSFTPNGDGVNDSVTITVDNPFSAALAGDVYDVNGARLAALSRGPTTDSLVWDGKKASGEAARPGVYIYQIRGGAASATGAVILAR